MLSVSTCRGRRHSCEPAYQILIALIIQSVASWKPAKRDPRRMTDVDLLIGADKDGQRLKRKAARGRQPQRLWDPRSEVVCQRVTTFGSGTLSSGCSGRRPVATQRSTGGLAVIAVIARPSVRNFDLAHILPGPFALTVVMDFQFQMFPFLAHRHHRCLDIKNMKTQAGECVGFKFPSTDWSLFTIAD